MTDKPLDTGVRLHWAGRRRRLELFIEQIGELERECNAGIGAIFVRLATAQFFLADVRETIRLGLVGGGESESDAEALVRAWVDRRPLQDSLPLAHAVLNALINGAPKPPAKKATAEGPDGPATSPPITKPAA